MSHSGGSTPQLTPLQRGLADIYGVASTASNTGVVVSDNSLTVLGADNGGRFAIKILAMTLNRVLPDGAEKYQEDGEALSIEIKPDHQQFVIDNSKAIAALVTMCSKIDFASAAPSSAAQGGEGRKVRSVEQEIGRFLARLQASANSAVPPRAAGAADDDDDDLPTRPQGAAPVASSLGGDNDDAHSVASSLHEFPGQLGGGHDSRAAIPVAGGTTSFRSSVEVRPTATAGADVNEGLIPLSQPEDEDDDVSIADSEINDELFNIEDLKGLEQSSRTELLGLYDKVSFQLQTAFSAQQSVREAVHRVTTGQRGEIILESYEKLSELAQLLPLESGAEAFGYEADEGERKVFGLEITEQWLVHNSQDANSPYSTFAKDVLKRRAIEDMVSMAGNHVYFTNPSEEGDRSFDIYIEKGEEEQQGAFIDNQKQMSGLREDESYANANFRHFFIVKQDLPEGVQGQRIVKNLQTVNKERQEAERLQRLEEEHLYKMLVLTTAIQNSSDIALVNVEGVEAQYHIVTAGEHAEALKAAGVKCSSKEYQGRENRCVFQIERDKLDEAVIRVISEKQAQHAEENKQAIARLSETMKYVGVTKKASTTASLSGDQYQLTFTREQHEAFSGEIELQRWQQGSDRKFPEAQRTRDGKFIVTCTNSDFALLGLKDVIPALDHRCEELTQQRRQDISSKFQYIEEQGTIVRDVKGVYSITTRDKSAIEQLRQQLGIAETSLKINAVRTKSGTTTYSTSFTEEELVNMMRTSGQNDFIDHATQELRATTIRVAATKGLEQILSADHDITKAVDSAVGANSKYVVDGALFKGFKDDLFNAEQKSRGREGILEFSQSDLRRWFGDQEARRYVGELDRKIAETKLKVAAEGVAAIIDSDVAISRVDPAAQDGSDAEENAEPSYSFVINDRSSSQLKRFAKYCKTGTGGRYEFAPSDLARLVGEEQDVGKCLEALNKEVERQREVAVRGIDSFVEQAVRHSHVAATKEEGYVLTSKSKEAFANIPIELPGVRVNHAGGGDTVCTIPHSAFNEYQSYGGCNSTNSLHQESNRAYFPPERAKNSEEKVDEKLLSLFNSMVACSSKVVAEVGTLRKKEAVAYVFPGKVNGKHVGLCKIGDKIKPVVSDGPITVTNLESSIVDYKGHSEDVMALYKEVTVANKNPRRAMSVPQIPANRGSDSTHAKSDIPVGNGSDSGDDGYDTAEEGKGTTSGIPSGSGPRRIQRNVGALEGGEYKGGPTRFVRGVPAAYSGPGLHSLQTTRKEETSTARRRDDDSDNDVPLASPYSGNPSSRPIRRVNLRGQLRDRDMDVSPASPYPGNPSSQPVLRSERVGEMWQQHGMVAPATPVTNRNLMMQRPAAVGVPQPARSEEPAIDPKVISTVQALAKRFGMDLKKEEHQVALMAVLMSVRGNDDDKESVNDIVRSIGQKVSESDSHTLSVKSGEKIISYDITSSESIERLSKAFSNSSLSKTLNVPLKDALRGVEIGGLVMTAARSQAPVVQPQGGQQPTTSRFEDVSPAATRPSNADLVVQQTARLEHPLHDYSRHPRSSDLFVNPSRANPSRGGYTAPAASSGPRNAEELLDASRRSQALSYRSGLGARSEASDNDDFTRRPTSAAHVLRSAWRQPDEPTVNSGLQQPVLGTSGAPLASVPMTLWQRSVRGGHSPLAAGGYAASVTQQVKASEIASKFGKLAAAFGMDIAGNQSHRDIFTAALATFQQGKGVDEFKSMLQKTIATEVGNAKHNYKILGGTSSDGSERLLKSFKATFIQNFGEEISTALNGQKVEDIVANVVAQSTAGRV